MLTKMNKLKDLISVVCSHPIVSEMRNRVPSGLTTLSLLPPPNPHIITEILTGYRLVLNLANLSTTYNPQPPCLQSKSNSNPWSPSTCQSDSAESLSTGPELYQCGSKEKGKVFPVNAVVHGKHKMPSFEYKHICVLTGCSGD